MLLFMALASIQLSTDPGKILDFTGHSPASVFNQAILPRVSALSGLLPPQEAQTVQPPAPTMNVASALQPKQEQFLSQVQQPAANRVDEGQDYSGYDAPLAPQEPQQQAAGYKSPAANLVGFVKEFEGFNPKAFGDYKQTSIGYGTRARQGETSISREDAEARLAEELSKARGHVEQVNQKHGYKFAPHEMDALTSFAYNTGNINQLTAGGTRQRDEIAQKMLEYNKAGGKPLSGLTRRRQAESALFTRGY
jgi:GH24 family phage-related lysozyme (muramidase)